MIHKHTYRYSTPVYAYLFIYMYAHIYTNMFLYSYKHIYTQICVCIHICTFIHTYT